MRDEALRRQDGQIVSSYSWSGLRLSDVVTFFLEVLEVDIGTLRCLRCTRSVAMSEGLMPLIRPAWPSDRGRTRWNFSRASARSWTIA